MTQRTVLPFLDDSLAIELPADWRVQGPYKPAVLTPADSVTAELLRAIGNPVDGPPLQDLAGKRILLCVDDISRPTPVHTFFPALLDHLAAQGAERADIAVLFALGVHRAMTGDEARTRLGLESLDDLAWHNHDCNSEQGHVSLGTTSRGTPVRLNRHLAGADLIVLVGAIEPHPLLGFGGGLKMIVPGLAHEETIAANHMQGVTPERYNYVGVPESPMRLDLEEAALMLNKPIFLVNALLGAGQQVHRFVCGDPVAAHREGIRQVAEAARQPLAAPVDVAIVTSNPLNADLRQGMKSMAHAEPAVKEGGVIVGMLECRNGIGDIAIPPKSLPNGLLRFVLRLLGRHRVLWFVDKVKRGAGTEERFLSHFSLQVVRKVHLLVYAPNLPPDTGKRMGIFRQFTSLDEALAEAARLAPKTASVAIFPESAATFPDLSPQSRS